MWVDDPTMRPLRTSSTDTRVAITAPMMATHEANRLASRNARQARTPSIARSATSASISRVEKRPDVVVALVPAEDVRVVAALL